MVKASFLGRFQPLHLGHSQVIENYREEYDGLELIIGSSDRSRTEENPLTVEEREKIIRECFPDIDIRHLPDEEDDDVGDRKWAEQLEKEMDGDVLLTANPNVKQLVEQHTGIEVHEQDQYDEEIYSGTEVRRRIKSGEEWRYLVPDCAKEIIDDLKEVIKKSGVQYEFEPGWKKENAYHGTAEK